MGHVQRNYFIVPESHVGLLYENGAYVKTLRPGRYKAKRKWYDQTVRTYHLVDLRQRSLTIKGQEILTADKVAIRVTLLVYFQVNDAEAAVHNVASYEERIYEDVQLAARRFLASRTLDAILSDRNEISDAVREDVLTAASSYGVEIRRADVKDLVFPGNLREIMNQVLETDRRAEAKLITARKDAEAARIKAAADWEAERLRLEAEKQRVRMTAEAEREKIRFQIESDVEEANAVRDQPVLLKLRTLQTLREMSRAGARFVVGLDAESLRHALDHDDEP